MQFPDEEWPTSESQEQFQKAFVLPTSADSLSDFESRTGSSDCPAHSTFCLRSARFAALWDSSVFGHRCTTWEFMECCLATSRGQKWSIRRALCNLLSPLQFGAGGAAGSFKLHCLCRPRYLGEVCCSKVSHLRTSSDRGSPPLPLMTAGLIGIGLLWQR